MNGRMKRVFDPYAVDISKCDNFYRTFLNVWYGVPCFMTKNVKGNRPINQSKTYGYMRVFMKNSPEKRPEDVTWKGICDYARSSHNFMFCIAMVCFLIENGLYRGEYKDELQVHLSEFHLLLESDSRIIGNIFCYDDIPYLLIDTYDDGRNVTFKFGRLKSRHPFYISLLKKYFKNHDIFNHKKVLTALSMSLDDYDGDIEDYTDFNGKTFWHQAEHRRAFADDIKEMNFYVQFLLTFYRSLITDYSERDFFADSDDMSTGFILAHQSKKYIIDRYDVVRFGLQTHLVSNPRLVLLFSNMDRVLTVMSSEDTLPVDISQHDSGPYTRLFDVYLSNLDAKTCVNAISGGMISFIARVLSDVLSFKKKCGYSVDPDYISRTDTMLIRNLIEEYGLNLNTMNAKLGGVRRFFQFLQANGTIRIEDRALSNLEQYEEPTRSEPESIPDEDLVALLSYMKERALCDNRWHCAYIILHILIETPIRISAACSLKRNCIKPSLQTGRYELQTIQKTSHGRKESYIISDSLAKLIESYQMKTEALMNNIPYAMKNSLFIYENSPGSNTRYAVMASEAFNRILRDGLAVTSSKRYSAQNIRDTHMNKADLYNAMKRGSNLMLSVLTGHKSPTTTLEHYIEYDLRKYMECMYNVDFDAVNQMFKGYDLLNNVKPAVPSEVDQTIDSVVNGCGFCTCDDCHNPPEMDCFVCRHFICTPAEEPFFKKEIENIDRLCQTTEMPLHEKETMNLKKTVLAMYLAGIYQLGNGKGGGTDR